MEVLHFRPKRARQQPDFLQPTEELRAFAQGSRKRKREAQPGDVERCMKPACECVAVAAERDELRERLDAEVAAHKQLRAALHELASSLAGGDGAAEFAGSALQHALMEVLDGEGEEEREGVGDEESDARVHTRVSPCHHRL